MMVAHPAALFFALMLFMATVLPILIGFIWIRPDANRRGQPGVLWALLTIPLSWLAVLVYLIVRALTEPAISR
jgi:hypothetical protein